MRITRATGSLPFVVSSLILDGSLSHQKFSDEKVNNEQKQSVMRKVKEKLTPKLMRIIRK